MEELELLQINNNQAHLWYICPEKVADVDKFKSFFEVLSEQEKSRQQKFVFEKDRHLFLVAHAFVRFCLSKYAAVKPEEWTFRENEYGKPYVDYKINGFPLKYNLSHTEGLIACLITLQHEVGVDVESVRVDKDRLDIAERFFSRDEFLDLKSIRPDLRHKRFCEYWTLKEAYVKARGIGISLSLDKFFFSLNKKDDIRISFYDDRYDKGDGWQFSLSELKDKFICASAIKSNGIPVTVTITEEEL